MADGVDPKSPVHDDESVFRRLDPARRPCAIDANGVVRVSREAFFDPDHRPSVDRAILRAVEDAQENPENGVAELIAGRVRQIEHIPSYDKRGKTVVANHAVDVVADPVEPDNPHGWKPNPAHAVVAMTPHTPNDRVFKRMRERLAEQARVIIEPPSLRRSPDEGGEK